MSKRIMFPTIVVVLSMVTTIFASAIGDVKIYKDGQCGYYGGENVYLANKGTRPVKATIERVQTYDGNSVRDYLKKYVDPGESVLLGCDTYNQGSGSGTGFISYKITGAYYPN